jgi:hypothetical protein
LETLRFRPYFQNVSGGVEDRRGAGIAYSTNGSEFVLVAASGTPTFSGTSEFAVDLSSIPSLRGVTSSVTLRIHLFGNGPFEFTGLGGPGDDVVVMGRVSAPIVVERPVLAAVLADGIFRISFLPRVSEADVLERSADLGSWSAVVAEAGAGGERVYREPASDQGAFFRLRP